MQLSTLLYGHIPALADVPSGFGKITALPNIFGGHHISSPSGELLATTTPNIFGGVDVRGADGSFTGSTQENIFGGQNSFGADGMNLGHTQSNMFGGETMYGADASILGNTHENIFGGETLLGADGSLIATTSPNVFGGIDIDVGAFASPDISTFGSGLTNFDLNTDPFSAGSAAFDTGAFDSIGGGLEGIDGIAESGLFDGLFDFF